MYQTLIVRDGGDPPKESSLGAKPVHSPLNILFHLWPLCQAFLSLPTLIPFEAHLWALYWWSSSRGLTPRPLPVSLFCSHQEISSIPTVPIVSYTQATHTITSLAQACLLRSRPGICCTLGTSSWMPQRHPKLHKGKPHLMPFILTSGPLLGPLGSMIGTAIHADLEGVFTSLFPIQFTHNPCQVCLLHIS